MLKNWPKTNGSSKNMKKQVIKLWFGPMQATKITLPSDLLMLVFACISRGLRHKNPVKTNTKSTFYVADFEDLGLENRIPRNFLSAQTIGIYNI